jgi:hypothetical protein
MNYFIIPDELYKINPIDVYDGIHAYCSSSKTDIQQAFVIYREEFIFMFIEIIDSQFETWVYLKVLTKDGCFYLFLKEQHLNSIRKFNEDK